jgi:hypothetical protein
MHHFERSSLAQRVLWHSASHLLGSALEVIICNVHDGCRMQRASRRVTRYPRRRSGAAQNRALLALSVPAGQRQWLLLLQRRYTEVELHRGPAIDSGGFFYQVGTVMGL